MPDLLTGINTKIQYVCVLQNGNSKRPVNTHHHTLLTLFLVMRTSRIYSLSNFCTCSAVRATVTVLRQPLGARTPHALGCWRC